MPNFDLGKLDSNKEFAKLAYQHLPRPLKNLFSEPKWKLLLRVFAILFICIPKKNVFLFEQSINNLTFGLLRPSVRIFLAKSFNVVYPLVMIPLLLLLFIPTL